MLEVTVPVPLLAEGRGGREKPGLDAVTACPHQERGTSDSPSPSWFCLCKDLCCGESSSVRWGLVEEGQILSEAEREGKRRL